MYTLQKNLKITVPEIAIDENSNMIKLNRNTKYIRQFNKIMDELEAKNNLIYTLFTLDIVYKLFRITWYGDSSISI